MDITIKNTINEIAMQVKLQRRAVKDIATDCAFYAKQTSDTDAKALFVRLSYCKTRKKMSLVLANFKERGMKVKLIELSETYLLDGEGYEFYGLEPGGIYEVVAIYEELESMVIKNKYDRNVMVYNHEVERCED